MRVHRGDPIKDARINMVFTQLKTNGVVNEAVLQAFEAVPRDEFVPVEALAMAYGDGAIFCGVEGRYMFAPQTLGIMLQYMNLRAGDPVLVVGANYGYMAAILFELGCKVHIIESDSYLALGSSKKLKKYPPQIIHESPLLEGLAEHAPYRAIIVEVGLESLPKSLISQLAANGHLGLCLTPRGCDVTKAHVFEKNQDSLTEIFAIEANMPLCTPLLEQAGFVF